MKTWTVVIELKTPDDAEGYELSQFAVEGLITRRLENSEGIASFRVMETIAAPYGAQHRDGVYIKEVKP